MKCKVFVSPNVRKFEDALNEWLQDHETTIEQIVFSCVRHDDNVSLATEYVCVIFYKKEA